MSIKCIKIISKCGYYFPPPEPSDEVEQHLTISSTGEVCCSHYIYGNGRHELKHEEQIFIDKEAASGIFDHIEMFIRSYELYFATDVGKWQLEVEFDDGRITELGGVFIRPAYVEDVDLSEMIRKEIPIENLFVFDGGPDIDEEGEEIKLQFMM